MSGSANETYGNPGTLAGSARAITRRGRDRLLRAGSVPVALAGLAVLVTASCSSGSSAAAGAAGSAGAVQGGTQATQQGQGGGLSGGPTHHMSGVYSGTFSAAFARCMRADGVPGFPDPDGKPGQVASSGIETSSASFQAALYGPCKSLAPASWVSVPPLGPPPSAETGS
jgi:hypothetical protein